MSRKRSEQAILAYREQFIAGARERGATVAVAERVFEQIRGFSGFGFPKAHAVAFGLLAYQSTWLRVHYGPEFLCSLLNEQPMGFYPPDALVHEAQRGASRCWRPTSTAAASSARSSRPAVRVGLGYIAGFREEDARALVEERERGGPYADLADLASRSGAEQRGARAARLGGGLRADRRAGRSAAARGPVAARRRQRRARRLGKPAPALPSPLHPGGAVPA